MKTFKRLTIATSLLILCNLLLISGAACAPKNQTAENKHLKKPSSQSIAPAKQPPLLRPEILRTFAHDPNAFTQGLVFYEGLLFESTGRVGHSSLRQVNPLDGSIMKRIDIPDVFAEGMIIHDNRFIVLTWRAGNALKYRYPDMEKAGHWNYTGEGWGLAKNNEHFFMSNGSDTIYLRNPADFSVTGTIAVSFNGAPVTNLNELEFARGKLYANIWHTRLIVEIDVKTGKVSRAFDCTDLVDIVLPQSNQDVLNGIAFNQGTGTFFLTGKNWRYMFEVKLP